MNAVIASGYIKQLVHGAIKFMNQLFIDIATAIIIAIQIAIIINMITNQQSYKIKHSLHNMQKLFI